MSKITLEPNDSGAGTFSIVSPDSNTNRTLNLPDEAGKLLSTGNNDPAEVFKQSNILGTVSESGGVPTGAIIEIGSNSNGEFVKFADGTMIVTLFHQESYEGESLLGVKSLTFPSAFASTPSLTVGADMSSIGSFVDRTGFCPYDSLTNSGCRVFLFFLNLSSNHISLRARLTAIGRWY